jgi:hypothetical protein
VGLGFNLLSGNYEVGTMLVIHDPRFWEAFGDQLRPNWEDDHLQARRVVTGKRQSRICSPQRPTAERSFSPITKRCLIRVRVKGPHLGCVKLWPKPATEPARVARAVAAAC